MLAHTSQACGRPSLAARQAARISSGSNFALPARRSSLSIVRARSGERQRAIMIAPCECSGRW